jgi:two-component system response regulator YesN
MVADDEPRHRRGISEMIKRLRPSYEVLEVKNGEEAIEVVRTHTIDIVITDIKMPLKDGLEFLGEISDLLTHTKVLILSGYANFQYAQKALQLGAFDYVLKPVNDERCDDMLQKVEKKIESEKREASKNEYAMQRLNNALPVYLDHQLNRWVRNELTAIEVQEISALFDGKDSGFVIVTGIGNYSQAIENCTPDDISELKLNMKYWMKAALDPAFHSLSFFDESSEDMMTTIITGKNTGGLVVSLNIEKLYSFQENLKSSYGFDVVTGIGSEFVDIFKNIVKSYRNAIAAFSFRFFFEDKGIIFYTDINLNNTRQVFSKYAEETDLLEAIKRTDYSVARDTAEKIINRLTADQYPHPEHLKEEIMIILLNAAKLSQSLLPEEDYLILVSKIKESIHGAKGYTELKEIINQTIDDIIEAMCLNKNSKNDNIIQVCKKYIDKCYMEDLSLVATAEKYGFNANYFGSLFKSNTNMTFSEYLLSIRMKHAQDLLTNNNLRIYEIAEKTGYRDVKYFIRVFKKIYGIAPDEFRKLGNSK